MSLSWSLFLSLSLLASLVILTLSPVAADSPSIIARLPTMNPSPSIVYHRKPLESTLDLSKQLGISHRFITPELEGHSNNIENTKSTPYLRSIDPVHNVPSTINSNIATNSTFHFNVTDALIYRWLSVVAYTDNPINILYWNCTYCSIPLISHFQCSHVIQNSDTQTLAYVGTDPIHQRILVIFRGSDNVENWILDFEAWHIDTPLDGIPGAYTAEGFYKCFHALRDPIYNAVLSNIARHPAYQLMLVGHSLGGAIGSIMTLDFTYNAHLNIETFSFGTPRAGDQGFADAFEQYVPHYWRMVKGRDPVPHVPMEWLGFQHIGHEIWEQDGPLVQEYIVCNWSLNEDPNCSDSDKDWLFNFKASDHTSYMNITDG